MPLLILGGTTEASRLATVLADRAAPKAVLSLAGRTATPAASPLPRRIGGFGGIDGLCAYLAADGVWGVVDATHPFAARISAHAVAACARLKLPLLAFERPAWRADTGDRWTAVPDIASAVGALAAREPSSVFLTTGRLDLAAFRAAPQHRYLIRTIDPALPEDMPPDTVPILGRGPFTVADEMALMEHHGVSLLVTKNSGGTASRAKLDAARQRSVPVLMVERPAIPPRPATNRLDAVMAWIDRHAPPL